MLIKIAPNRQAMAKFSGSFAAESIRQILEKQNRARIVVATGASQLEVLQNLTNASEIDWARVDGFHLDEYIGLPSVHAASFCGYLAKRFVDEIPIGSFHYLDGMSDPEITIRNASKKWCEAPIDLALIGIGENGHLAFNDPPADFDTTEVYHVVDLDRACRQQQVGEGWFPSVDACPSQAISMTIHAILESRKIICSVPDNRKARAVAMSVEGPITPNMPGSILRRHPDVTLVLDDFSASLLSQQTIESASRINR